MSKMICGPVGKRSSENIVLPSVQRFFKNSLKLHWWQAASFSLGGHLEVLLRSAAQINSGFRLICVLLPWVDFESPKNEAAGEWTTKKKLQYKLLFLHRMHHWGSPRNKKWCCKTHRIVATTSIVIIIPWEPIKKIKNALVHPQRLSSLD